MNNDFFKFPSTPYLLPPGQDVRGDKIMTEDERSDFLSHPLSIEEKVDGANLGLSFNHQGKLLLQNRGSWIDLHIGGQWKKLPDWLTSHQDALLDHLQDRFIMFGEWCYARHSVCYHSLPDWFLGFDIYDKKTGLFLPHGQRDTILHRMGIVPVPLLSHGQFSQNELLALFSTSRLGNQPAEGLYLRADTADKLLMRAKIVRPDFTQAIETHWRKMAITPNRLSWQ